MRIRRRKRRRKRRPEIGDLFQGLPDELPRGIEAAVRIAAVDVAAGRVGVGAVLPPATVASARDAKDSGPVAVAIAVALLDGAAMNAHPVARRHLRRAAQDVRSRVAELADEVDALMERADDGREWDA